MFKNKKIKVVLSFLALPGTKYHVVKEKTRELIVTRNTQDEARAAAEIAPEHRCWILAEDPYSSDVVYLVETIRPKLKGQSFQECLAESMTAYAA